MISTGATLASLFAAAARGHARETAVVGPEGAGLSYGEFAALLQLSLILAVPALALQTVVARQVVRGAGAR